MSLKSVANIIVGSVMQSLDRRLVLGKTNTRAISILNLLSKSLTYAITRYNSGDTDYYNKIGTINKSIQKLKYECPDICVYRDRFLTDEISPIVDPVLLDNTIIMETSTGFLPLSYTDVIHGFPAPNVGVVEITSKTSGIDLNIDNEPVILNNPYNPNISFSARLFGDFTYINHTTDETCTLKGVDKTTYHEAIVVNKHQIVEMSPGKITMQYLNESTGGGSQIVNYDIPTVDHTETFTEYFQVRIKDIFNSSVWSNIATITLQFQAGCETLEECDQAITKTLPHFVMYTMTPEDFGMDADDDKIKLLSVSYSTGTFRLRTWTFVSNDVAPTIITREEIENGDVYWHASTPNESILFLEFKTAKENSFNYCDNSSTFTLTKLQS